MILETMPEVQRLSAEQKLILVDELWSELAAHPARIPVSPEQLAELDRRMEEYHRNPENVTTWEAVQQRLLGRTLT